MAQEPTDIGAFATEIFTDVNSEMQQRLEGYAEWSQADRDAVNTAIAKAAWNGILRGVALLAHDFNAAEQAKLADDPDADIVQLSPELRVDPAPDLWAQRYGGDA